MTKTQDDSSQKTGKEAKSEKDFTEAPLSDKIGSSLKRMYDDVVSEPIPDDFLSLLAKADTKSK